MKKFKLFLIPALIMSVGLVACSEKDDNEKKGELQLVAHYDLSSVVGVYDKDAADRGIDLKGDITSYFTNSTTGSSLSLTSVTASDSGVEKAQTSQGHKVGGIKLAAKPTYAGDFTMKFAKASIDKVELGVYSWSTKNGEEDFNLALNDVNTKYTGSAEMIKIELDIADASELKFSASLGDIANNSRPVISYIKLYENK